MAKTVAFDVEARQGLKRGIDMVAQSVRITLGPKGRNVVLEKKFGAPTVTNDGVYDRARDRAQGPRGEHRGAAAAVRSRRRRTTSPAMGQRRRRCSPRTMISEGFRERRRGRQPDQLKIGIEAAVKKVVEEIERVSVSPQGPRGRRPHRGDFLAVGDEIGELIAEAMDKVGKDGVITVEDGQGLANDARRRRGHAVRPGLPLALLCLQRGAPWRPSSTTPLC